MLHIIVLLLKFIGILLLAILGLILGLLLVILLVPIRYRVWVSHGVTFRAEGRVNWILHIIRLRVIKDEEQFRIRLRLFGIPLYDSARSRREGKLRRRKEKARRKEEETSKDGTGSLEQTLSEQTSQTVIIKTDDLTEKKAILTEKSVSEKREDGTEPKETDQALYTELKEGEAKEEIPKEEKHMEQDPNEGEDIEKDSMEEVPGAEEAEAEHPSEEELNIVSRLLYRIKGIFRGIRKKLKGLSEGIKRGYMALMNIKNKISLVKNFLREEENKAAFQITFGSLKRIFKHIRPRKLKSKVVFGTGDPCSTGQALGVVSILYGYYGEHVQIVPDFENKVFEGSHYARGRIRMGTLLIIVIKLLLDKRFNQLKRNFNILKEAL
jgi:hypothetical protein